MKKASRGSINPDHLTFGDVPDLGPSPKGKAIKRRSRASKKAPTTLLTADANNFRALVQQFTGCNNASPQLGAYTGPINLNFEQCTFHPRPRASEQKKKKERVELDYYNKQQQQQLLLHERCRIKSMSAAAAIEVDDDNNGDRELFAASSVDQNPRSDALTYDRGQELIADYETMLDDDFWGY